MELIDGARTSYGQNSGAGTTEVQNLWSSQMELPQLSCKISGAHINGAHKWSSHN